MGDAPALLHGWEPGTHSSITAFLKSYNLGSSASCFLNGDSISVKLNATISRADLSTNTSPKDWENGRSNSSQDM